MLRAFRVPPTTRGNYTLLEALPWVRQTRAFEAFIRVCDSGGVVGPGDHVRHALRGRLRAGDVRAPHREARRARDLIDGVLVYARAGELSVEPVALGRLAADVAEDLRPSLEAAGATLEIGELPEVDGDPRELRRAAEPGRQRAQVPRRGAAAGRALGPERQTRMGRDRA
jgi:hypothetical protein